MEIEYMRTIGLLKKVSCALFIILTTATVSACVSENAEINTEGTLEIQRPSEDQHSFYEDKHIDDFKEESDIVIEDENPVCDEDKRETILEEQRYLELTEEIKPTFLTLEFIYYIKGADISKWNYANYEEFTWFDTTSPISAEMIEDVRKYLARDYGIELDESITLDENSFITLSVGRKLRMLYYFEESRYDTFNGQVIARPVFYREYHPDTIFIYRVTPIPSYGFFAQYMTEDNEQFNTYNNIPFEFRSYDENMQTGVVHQGRNPYRREEGSRQKRWQELDEPLYGHVNVYEIDLRSLPTRNSSTRLRLTQGDYFTAFGYVDSGEDIDGSSLWYYVWSSYDSGNWTGYLHSSFINITSPPEGLVQCPECKRFGCTQQFGYC